MERSCADIGDLETETSTPICRPEKPREKSRIQKKIRMFILLVDSILSLLLVVTLTAIFVSITTRMRHNIDNLKEVREPESSQQLVTYSDTSTTDSSNSGSASLTSRIESLENENLDEDLKALEDRITSVESSVNSHGLSISSLQGSTSELLNEVNGVKSGLKNLGSEVNTMEATVADHTSRLTDAEGGVATANSEVVSITARVGIAEIQIDFLGCEVKKLNGQLCT